MSPNSNGMTRIRTSIKYILARSLISMTGDMLPNTLPGCLIEGVTKQGIIQRINMFRIAKRIPAARHYFARAAGILYLSLFFAFICRHVIGRAGTVRCCPGGRAVHTVLLRSCRTHPLDAGNSLIFSGHYVLSQFKHQGKIIVIHIVQITDQIFAVTAAAAIFICFED